MTQAQSTKKQKTTWEIAKPILLKFYKNGDITDDMKPSEVWCMAPEFIEVPCGDFRDNFAAMKRRIKKLKARADQDEAGFLHDMTIYKLAKDTPGYWDGSEAQRLLELDVENKKHERLKPELLWMSRPQHQEFALSKFRGHIHQNLRAKRETLYWIVKKKKKKRLQEAIKSGETVDDEDMEFLCDPVLEMQRNKRLANSRNLEITIGKSIQLEAQRIYFWSESTATSLSETKIVSVPTKDDVERRFRNAKALSKDDFE